MNGYDCVRISATILREMKTPLTLHDDTANDERCLSRVVKKAIARAINFPTLGNLAHEIITRLLYALVLNFSHTSVSRGGPCFSSADVHRGECSARVSVYDVQQDVGLPATVPAVLHTQARVRHCAGKCPDEKQIKLSKAVI